MTRQLHNNLKTNIQDQAITIPPAAVTAHIGAPEQLPDVAGTITESSTIYQNPTEKSGRSLGSKARMAAFSLMLVVPVALTGCGDDDDYCEYDQNGNPYNCDDSSGGSHYYGGYGSSYKKGSSGSHSGFGSSGSHSSFFGG
ncbi:hypothetical protein [Paenibacillus sp. Z6-24]